MSKPHALARLALPALCLTLQCLTAHAQYQWRDENGRMVFSDKPPPTGIDPAKVIRADPGRLRVTTPANPATGAADPSGSAGSRTGSRAGAVQANAAPGPETTADKDLAARRKAQQQADAEKKKREDAEQAAKVAKACDDMRTEVRTLETGMRVSRVNAQGEREFLSDEERSRRVDAVQRDIKEHCKQG